MKHSDCIEQKNRVKIGNAWEKKYAKFESYNGMPERVPHFIIGNGISRAMDLVMLRFGRSLQRIKGVPYGVNGE